MPLKCPSRSFAGNPIFVKVTSPGSAPTAKGGQAATSVLSKSVGGRNHAGCSLKEVPERRPHFVLLLAAQLVGLSATTGATRGCWTLPNAPEVSDFAIGPNDLSNPKRIRAVMARCEFAPHQLDPWWSPDHDGMVDPLASTETRSSVRAFMRQLWDACVVAESGRCTSSFQGEE